MLHFRLSQIISANLQEQVIGRLAHLSNVLRSKYRTLCLGDVGGVTILHISTDLYALYLWICLDTFFSYSASSLLRKKII